MLKAGGDAVYQIGENVKSMEYKGDLICQLILYKADHFLCFGFAGAFISSS